jgi:hypothetical protein
VLQAESYDADDEGVLQVRLPRGAKTEELTLTPVAPRIYEAVLPTKRQGTFPITIVKRKEGKIINQKNETVMVSPAVSATSNEYRQQQPNRELLQELAEGTGGQVDPDLDELVSQKREGKKTLTHPLDGMLIAAALLFLLGDIAVRVFFGPPL